MTMIELPEAVRLRAEAGGEAARAWFAGLPGLVAELERAWGIVAGRVLHGGSAGYLAEAVTQAGEPVVLKLAMPGEEVAGEIAVLERAQGRGYARLLRHDLSRSALLLERLGPSLASSNLPVDDQMQAICATLTEAWACPVPEGLMTGAGKARWLIDFIQETRRELDSPCSDRAVAYALQCAESRAKAFDPAACVLVHGDGHNDNTLQAPGSPSGFKFVDPDGLLAEPAYDLAILMRDWSAELLAGDALKLGHARAAYLAELTGADPQAIWEWGVVERMSTGLLATKLGYQPMGRETLAVADAWAPQA
jgi:streptomycin 6-kinase